MSIHTGKSRSDLGSGACSTRPRSGWLWPRIRGAGGTRGRAHAAARAGHLEALRWAREYGCPWTRVRVYTRLRERGLGRKPGASLYTRKRLSLSRLRAGTWSDVLRWAREHDCPWYAWTCHAAAKCGHLEVLRWAQAHGCL